MLKYIKLILLCMLCLISHASNSCTVPHSKIGYNFLQKMAASESIFLIHLNKKNSSIRLIEQMKGNKSVASLMPIAWVYSEIEHKPIHNDLAFWLGKKSTSVVTRDCKIHYPVRSGRKYLLMTNGADIISLEPIESNADEWMNFVRKNLNLTKEMKIPGSVYYKSIKERIEVSCSKQENPFLNIFAKITLAKICNNSSKVYLLLTADGLDVFIPVRNKVLYPAEQKSENGIKVAFDKGVVGNHIFQGYELSK